MTKSKLINELHNSEGEEVIVKVEGGLYYPVTQVITQDNKIILFCKDISKVNK